MFEMRALAVQRHPRSKELYRQSLTRRLSEAAAKTTVPTERPHHTAELGGHIAGKPEIKGNRPDPF